MVKIVLRGPRQISIFLNFSQSLNKTRVWIQCTWGRGARIRSWRSSVYTLCIRRPEFCIHRLECFGTKSHSPINQSILRVFRIWAVLYIFYDETQWRGELKNRIHTFCDGFFVFVFVFVSIFCLNICLCLSYKKWGSVVDQASWLSYIKSWDCILLPLRIQSRWREYITAPSLLSLESHIPAF